MDLSALPVHEALSHRCSGTGIFHCGTASHGRVSGFLDTEMTLGSFSCTGGRFMNVGRLCITQPPTPQIPNGLNSVVSFESGELSWGTYRAEAAFLQPAPVGCNCHKR